METKTREALIEELSFALADLDDKQLAHKSESILDREVVSLDNGFFVVGTRDFKPIKSKYFSDEAQYGCTLDGRRVKDGDKLILKYPDNTEQETSIEKKETDLSTHEVLLFNIDFHGQGLYIELRAGQLAKWIDQ